MYRPSRDSVIIITLSSILRVSERDRKYGPFIDICNEKMGCISLLREKRWLLHEGSTIDLDGRRTSNQCVRIHYA